MSSPGPIGIYAILNDVSGDAYVGQSINVNSRIRSHFWRLENARHYNRSMQASYDEFGAIAFTGEILEIMPDEVSSLGRDHGAFQYWLDFHEYQYLIALRANLNEHKFGLFHLHYRGPWVSVEEFDKRESERIALCVGKVYPVERGWLRLAKAQ